MEDNDLDPPYASSDDARDVVLDPDEFVSLGALLAVENHSTGVLATAIEKNGVQGWDRYGRFGTFTKKTPEYQAALELIARQAQFEWCSLFQKGRTERSPAEASWDLNDATDFYRYGWLRHNLPNLAAIAKAQGTQPGVPTELLDARSEKACLGTIGALLSFIEGDYGFEPHPQFQTEKALIAVLSKKFAGYYGLKPRTFQNRFAQAKALLKDT
jgi:hypothetical protein